MMMRILQLAFVLTLISAASVRAQITDPNNLIAPPPPPIQFRGRHLVKPTTDFQWMWQYTQPAPNGNEGALLNDPHFAMMLQDNLKAPQSFYRDGTLPLAAVAQQYFGVNFSSVRAEGNRTISLIGCVQHQCEDQGLLWVDTAVQRPTVVFAATQWTAQGAPIEDPNAEFNLWVFTSRALDAEHPPVALVNTIAQWHNENHQRIHAALVIDPDGTPHQVNPAVLGATPVTK